MSTVNAKSTFLTIPEMKSKLSSVLGIPVTKLNLVTNPKTQKKFWQINDSSINLKAQQNFDATLPFKFLYSTHAEDGTEYANEAEMVKNGIIVNVKEVKLAAPIMSI